MLLHLPSLLKNYSNCKKVWHFRVPFQGRFSSSSNLQMNHHWLQYLIKVFLLKVPPGSPAISHQCANARPKGVCLGISFPWEPPMRFTKFLSVHYRLKISTSNSPYSRISHTNPQRSVHQSQWHCGHKWCPQPRYTSSHTKHSITETGQHSFVGWNVHLSSGPSSQSMEYKLPSLFQSIKYRQTADRQHKESSFASSFSGRFPRGREPRTGDSTLPLWLCHVPLTYTHTNAGLSTIWVQTQECLRDTRMKECFGCICSWNTPYRTFTTDGNRNYTTCDSCYDCHKNPRCHLTKSAVTNHLGESYSSFPTHTTYRSPL